MAQSCVICKGPATKKVLWADGRAYQPSCPAHVEATKDMLRKKNGDMAEIVDGVQDLSDCLVCAMEGTLDLANSAVYPSLERKPGGPDNWVEKAGGLPKYIERIAKHLHYERGMSISHAIASAVNTIKRWARKGKVAKYGDPNHKHVNSSTVAKAQRALVQWEAKRAAGSLNLSDGVWRLIAGYELIDLALESTTSATSTPRGTLLAEVEPPRGLMDIAALAERANAVADPEQRHNARLAVLELSSSIAPKGGSKGKTSDGRPSYKRQGKWGHGFVPLDKVAKEAKAKGSPIAMKRMDRLFNGQKVKSKLTPTSQSAKDATPKGDPKPKQFKSGLHVQAGKGRAGSRSAGGRKDDSQTASVEDKGIKDRATSIGQLRHARFQDAVETKGPQAEQHKETSKETRIPKRARQNWDEIPSKLKTVRNGKRYVLAVFGGKNTLTEWVGGINEVTSTPLAKRKVMRTLSSADASKMTSGQIRAMLKNQRQISPQVRKMLNKYLQIKIKEQRTRA